MPTFSFPLATTPSAPSGTGASGSGGSTSDNDLGVDIMCEDDLDPRLRLVSGTRNAAWAVAWRTRTPRGRLFYALDYGKSLLQYCHGEVDRRELAGCRSGLEAEARKDPRVRRARASAQWNPATRTLQTRLECHSAGGPFTLIDSIDGVTETLTVET